jgi:hypothetical protein
MQGNALNQALNIFSSFAVFSHAALARGRRSEISREDVLTSFFFWLKPVLLKPVSTGWDFGF